MATRQDKYNKIIDISEDEIFDWGCGILELLLLDRTTGKNIIWATNDYDGHDFYDEIRIEDITGFNCYTIQPRVCKSSKIRKERSQKMAEVFTPAWVCNSQNNKIDSAWFDGPSPFNEEILLEDGSKGWKVNRNPIQFPNKKGKSWMDYVYSPRLEIACGEAPYICSRYDATNPQNYYGDVYDRIGLLDRKLRIVTENAPVNMPRLTGGWNIWAAKAFQSIYAFEWQGDNLLLARESLLYTYREFYKARWGKFPSVLALKKIAEIISWNVWQMDGLTYGIPMQQSDDPSEAKKHEFTLCKIMEWTRCRELTGNPVTFKSIVEANKK